MKIRHVRHVYGGLIATVGGGFLVLAVLAARAANGAGSAAVAGWVGAGLLAWVGVSGVLVALAYLARAPQVLGKRRATGTFPAWAYVVWSPYLAIAKVVRDVIVANSREAAADEVATGIYVGRIPEDGAVPPGVTLVIDLCAEFAAARLASAATAYLAIPTLDGCAPHDADAQAAVELARQHSVVLVHCAAGHGRSATIAVLIALDRGLFADGDAAIRAFQRVRSGVSPTSEQRALIARSADITRAGS